MTQLHTLWWWIWRWRFADRHLLLPAIQNLDLESVTAKKSQKVKAKIGHIKKKIWILRTCSRLLALTQRTKLLKAFWNGYVTTRLIPRGSWATRHGELRWVNLGGCRVPHLALCSLHHILFVLWQWQMVKVKVYGSILLQNFMSILIYIFYLM